MRDDLDGLKKTRESLDAQKHKNWTHIIVDGDSRDGTKKYLKSLPSENTIYISEQDSGIYNAMNKGWRLAQANSFVFYLNARDVFATNVSLTKAASALRESIDGIWGCTTHEEINEDGTGWVCKLVSPPTVSNQLHAFGYRSHQGVVMEKELIDELGGFDETYKIASDWDLIVRAMKHTKPVVWAHPLGRFEIGGFSSLNLLNAHYELINLRKKYLPRTFSHIFFELLWRDIYLQQFGRKARVLWHQSFIKWVKFLGSSSSAKVSQLMNRAKIVVPTFGFIISINIKRVHHKKRPRQKLARSTRTPWRVQLIQILHSKLEILPYAAPEKPSNV